MHGKGWARYVVNWQARMGRGWVKFGKDRHGLVSLDTVRTGMVW